MCIDLGLNECWIKPDLEAPCKIYRIELIQILLFQVQLFQEMPEGLYFK